MTGEFDFSQIPPLLSLVFTGATLGGVIKVVYWTANHDSRMANVEKDLQQHVEADKVAHGDLADNYKELSGKVERREKRLIAVEHDIAWLSAPRQGFPGNPRRDTSDDFGPVDPRINRGNTK